MSCNFVLFFFLISKLWKYIPWVVAVVVVVDHCSKRKKRDRTRTVCLVVEWDTDWRKRSHRTVSCTLYRDLTVNWRCAVIHLPHTTTTEQSSSSTAHNQVDSRRRGGGGSCYTFLCIFFLFVLFCDSLRMELNSFVFFRDSSELYSVNNEERPKGQGQRQRKRDDKRQVWRHQKPQETFVE